MRNLHLLLLSLILCNVLHAQDCKLGKMPFKGGERTSYHVRYNLGFIWADAGHVTFTVADSKFDNKNTYHFVGAGGSYPRYDWVFKVRDKYQSHALKQSMEPVKFIREVKEGKTELHYDYSFDTKRNRAYVDWNKINEEQKGKDTLSYPDCTFDVITAIYYCRSIDFSSLSPDDTIPLTLMLDRQLEKTYLRYLGVKMYETPDKKQIECIVFRPNLIDGTIFKSGENMEVWVTNDANKVPIYIESKILIGSIKVYLKDYEGLLTPADY